MPRTDLYIKVVIEHDKSETPERLASEVCRQAMRIYGVETAEMTSFVTHED